MTRREPPITRAAIYCRLSHDAEGDTLAVKRQEQDCRALAKRKGWTVVDVYVDNDISASDRRKVRPNFKRMARDIESGIVDAVVVYNTARLTRQPRELEDVIDWPVKFATCSGDIDLSTDQGRFMARTLANHDRMYVESMSTNRRRKLVEVAKNGGAHGGVNCFGYRWEDGKLVVHAPEATLIREAADGILRGRPVTQVVAEWNAKDISTRRGGPWRLHTLKGLLLAPTVAGLRTHTPNDRMHVRGDEATITPGTWQAVITPVEQEQLRSILVNDARSQKLGGRYRGRKLLSGLARCGCEKKEHRHPGGVCGSAMRSHANGYVCDGHNNGQRGGCTRVNRDRVEEYVTIAALTHYVEEVAPALKKAKKPTNGKESALIARRTHLIDRMKAKRADYADDSIDAATLKVALAVIQKELDAIEKSLGTVHASRPRKVPTPTLTEAEEQAWRDAYAGTDPSTWSVPKGQKPGNLFAGSEPWGKLPNALDEVERQTWREFLDGIIETLTILPGGKGRPFAPERAIITWRNTKDVAS